MASKQTKEIQKGFVWYSVRTLMWIILVLFNLVSISNIFYDEIATERVMMVITLPWIILSVPLFILAIIHIDIYKKEGLWTAILSLIISGIVIISSLIGVASGLSSV